VSDSRLIRAAMVRRPHGVRGEVRAEALGGDARRFRRGLRLTSEDGALALTVRNVRRLGDGDLLLSFAEIATPEAAAPLRGTYLCVPEEAARRLPPGEWFVWQLVGLRAEDTEGAELGTVRDVESGAAHDVLVVDTPAGERRFPMVSAFVAAVELQSHRIVLTPWPEEPDSAD
jgi:16S rRNA processing protein RimM